VGRAKEKIEAVPGKNKNGTIPFPGRNRNAPGGKWNRTAIGPYKKQREKKEGGAAIAEQLVMKGSKEEGGGRSARVQKKGGVRGGRKKSGKAGKGMKKGGEVGVLAQYSQKPTKKRLGGKKEIALLGGKTEKTSVCDGMVWGARRKKP